MNILAYEYGDLQEGMENIKKEIKKLNHKITNVIKFDIKTFVIGDKVRFLIVMAYEHE